MSRQKPSPPPPTLPLLYACLRSCCAAGGRRERDQLWQWLYSYVPAKGGLPEREGEGGKQNATLPSAASNVTKDISQTQHIRLTCDSKQCAYRELKHLRIGVQKIESQRLFVYNILIIIYFMALSSVKFARCVSKLASIKLSCCIQRPRSRNQEEEQNKIRQQCLRAHPAMGRERDEGGPGERGRERGQEVRGNLGCVEAAAAFKAPMASFGCGWWPLL